MTREPLSTSILKTYLKVSATSPLSSSKLRSYFYIGVNNKSLYLKKYFEPLSIGGFYDFQNLTLEESEAIKNLSKTYGKIIVFIALTIHSLKNKTASGLIPRYVKKSRFI